MSNISLFLDEDVRVLLAEVLRNRGYNVSHVLETGRTGKNDEEQLAYADRNKMAILTHNVRDYTILAKSYEAQRKDHFGIIVSEQIPFHELLKRALRFLSSNTRDTIRNRLVWLSDYK
jgi:predicted nuclease of predicted toxin-antitoxin system